MNDHPADPATFTTRVTVPGGFLSSEEAVPGGRMFTFEQAQPIPTSALAIHVDPFQRVDGPAVPVGVGGADVQRTAYCPTGTAQTITAQTICTPSLRLGEMIRVLSGWFGPFPFPVHGAAVITPRVPALETATLMTMPRTPAPNG